MTPGSTLTQPSFALSSIIFVKCLDTSTIIPFPTTCPASEVPAVRGISEVLLVAAKEIKLAISAFVLGIATARGISR